MVVGMGADLVPLGRHALDRLHVIGLIGYLLTNGKERRHGVVLLQHVEQLARRGPRAVVEGQRDDLLAVRVRVVLQIDVVGALLHRLLHGFARYLARARLHLGRLAGHVHVDGPLAQLHLARGRLLGGDIIVLGRVGAVVQLNDIALVQLGRAVGHLVAVDRAGKGGTAPLFQNLPIDREQVSRLRRDHALGDHVVQGRAPIHRARHAVDRHVELQGVQIQVHPHADGGQNDHGDDNGDDARLLLALLLVAPHVGIGSHLAIGLGGGNDPRGHLGRIARIAVRRRLVRLRLGLGRLIVMRLIGLRLVKARILRLGGSGRLLAGHSRLLLESRRLRCRLGLMSRWGGRRLRTRRRGPMGTGSRSRRRSTRMAARGLLVLSRIVAWVVRTVGGGLIGHRFIPLEVLQVVQELSRDYTTKRQNVHSRAAYISVKFAILKSSTKIERVSSSRRGAPRRKAPAIAARRPGIGP